MAVIFLEEGLTTGGSQIHALGTFKLSFGTHIKLIRFDFSVIYRRFVVRILNCFQGDSLSFWSNGRAMVVRDSSINPGTMVFPAEATGSNMGIQFLVNRQSSGGFGFRANVCVICS